MRKLMFRALAVGMGSVALLATTSGAAGSDFCDLSWVGTGISAAPTDSGHLIALRGTDGLLRLNEWKNSTQTWSGWMVPSNQVGELTEPWLQFQADGDQNLYVIGTDQTIHQWILTRSGNTWSGVNSRTSVNFANITPVNRVTSFRSDSAGYMQQQLIALNSNGTIWTRTWQPGRGWNAQWTQLGTLTNVVGAPYAIQLTQTTANLYVRTANGSIYQQYWNGTAWWNNWILVPTSYTSGGSPATVAGNPVSVFSIYHYLFSASSSSSPSPIPSNVAVYQVYAGGWQGWDGLQSLTGANVAFDPSKSMAAVTLPGSQIALYGLDQSGSVWRATTSGSTRDWSSGSQPNCVQPQVTP